MAGYGILDHMTLSAELSAGTNHPDGIGPVEVQQPRVRGRRIEGEKIRFSLAILPPYARRSKSMDALIPILYLRGISSGDLQDGHPLKKLAQAMTPCRSFTKLLKNSLNHLIQSLK